MDPRAVRRIFDTFDAKGVPHVRRIESELRELSRS